MVIGALEGDMSGVKTKGGGRMTRKINQEEYEVLKNLNDKWKWIARDKDEEIWAYNSRPNKLEESWDAWTFTELNKDLFQFIKWEDEEPYNIAELIEEYDSSKEIILHEDFDVDNLTLKQLDGFKQTLKVIKESEETEVKKDKEWALNKLDDYLSVEGVNEARNALTFAKGVINQLDEPEVLSQEWVDENVVEGDFRGEQQFWYGRFIEEEKVRSLLVPKQELPVIPQWVADNIESKKRVGTRLNVAMSAFPETSLEKELDIDEHECNEIYARAWLDGYTVKKEKKYQVKDKNVFMLFKLDGKVVPTAEHFIVSITSNIENDLTEQEIKDYDERYFAFAEPVEEEE